MFVIPVPGIQSDDVPAPPPVAPTNIEQVICEQCGVVVGKTHLAGHMTQVHLMKTDDNVICEICGALMLKRSYRRHIREYHSDERKFECKICNAKLKSQFYMRYHMKIHENTRDYKCHLCPKAYNTRNTLDIHLYMKHERSEQEANKTVECDECDETFANWWLLKVHKGAHERGGRKRERKVYVERECPYCGKAVKKLREHIQRVHERYKPHECTSCGRKFMTKWDCDKHMEGHLIPNRRQMGPTSSVQDRTIINKFTCNICEKGFPTHKRLCMHTFRMHNPNRMRKFDPYFCFYCKKRFDDIEDHHETVHSDMFHLCLICLKRYKTRNGAHAHSQKHHVDNSCVFCSKQFETPLQVKIHVYQDHAKPEPADDHCLDCNMQIDNIKEHFETIHSNFQFSCDLCHRKFEKTKPLEAHIKSFHKKFALEFYPIGWTTAKAKELAKDLATDGKSLKKRKTAVEVKSNGGESDSEPEVVLKILMRCKDCKETFDNKENFYDHQDSQHGRSRQDKRTDILKCPMCGEIFTSMEQLNAHADVHNSLTYRCKVCGKKFAFYAAKKYHVKTVHSSTNRPFKCKICNKGCSWKFELKDHMKEIHNVDLDHTSTRFPCIFCKESLENEFQRQFHLKQVHDNGSKPTRTCQLCTSSFKRYDEYKMHIMSHDDFDICIICGLFFSTIYDLDKHMETHAEPENDRRFECDLCGYMLSSKPLIQSHMASHIKRNDPFQCDQCDKGFKNLNSLNYHKDLHKGKREFVCKFCGKEYFRKQNLEIHHRTHTQEKPFECEICHKRFTSKPVLNIHKQKHPETKKDIECKECKLVFNDAKQAVVHDELYHPERRPFWCNFCKKSFKHEHSLNAHIKYLHKN